MDDLSRQVRSVPGLWAAWRTVRSKGVQSASRETQKAIARFDEHPDRHMHRIARQLRERRFRFSQATGVPIRRPGKQPRPLVVTPVQDRIVQRRILDVLQGRGELLEFLLTPTSFGGIKNRGVREAIAVAIREIQSGKRYYLRSDIRNFYCNIPKAIPLAIIEDRLPDDPEFRQIFREALEVELANLAELGPLVSLFPSSDVGVAQGSCLSLLMGNILLHEFDIRMNGRGIVCLRYVDDFLLLGPNQAHVMKAFQSARQMLSTFGLDAYDPRDAPEKAEFGAVESGFSFLGCRIIPGLIRPSNAAQTKLLTTIDKLVGESLRRLSGAKRSDFDRQHSIAHTLRHLGNVLEGWREQYSFCNDGNSIALLDQKVRHRLRRYLQGVKVLNAAFDEPARLRALGLSLLSDRSHKPIQWTNELEKAG